MSLRERIANAIYSVWWFNCKLDPDSWTLLAADAVIADLNLQKAESSGQFVVFGRIEVPLPNTMFWLGADGE